MIRNKIILIMIFSFKVVLAQELIYDEINSLRRLESRKVKATLGKDIKAPSLTTIILDASNSQPSDGSLTYEWTFSPNLIFQDDYDFEDSDSVIPYTDVELSSAGSKKSIKKIVTRNKYLEVDIPNSDFGTQFDVILRVQDQRGNFDNDTLLILVDDPIDDTFRSDFSDAQITNDNESFSIYDESDENREPLTETLINSNLLTIQPINKERLNPMEVDIINSFIFDFLKQRGMKNILDPNRDIPQEMEVNKLYQRSLTEVDTVLLVYNDTISINQDRSSFQTLPMDTIVTSINTGDTSNTSDTSFIYRRYETVTSLDTLYYTEVIDTVLKYNFSCLDFDCAAENAFLEQAGKVLSWGINDYSEFEFHYFDLEYLYNNEPNSYWEASKIEFSPYADSLLKYPESIGFDSNGNMVVVSGNRQTVNKLGFELYPINALKKDQDFNQLFYPAGVCSGYLGELYLTDKSDHTVYRLYEGLLSKLYSASRDENGLVLNGDPTLPTSIRIDPEGNLVVLFEGDGSVHQFDPRGVRTTLLGSGMIDDPVDIALSNEGSLYVTSSKMGQVFQVALDGSVVPVAGNSSSIATSTDGIQALESYLGSPTSIDFDALNRLYIADESFGSIRVVTNDGVISTITDRNNRVTNMNQMRVNNHALTTLYISHTLGHEITRLRYKTVSSSSRFEYIHFPYYIIKMDGIYGLENPIRSALDQALFGIVPKEKKSILSKIKNSNKKLVAYLTSHPIVFGLLLIALNQTISAVLSDGGAVDLPPDFPF